MKLQVKVQCRYNIFFPFPTNSSFCSLDVHTMFKIRDWERFKFLIDYEQIRVQYVCTLNLNEFFRYFIYHFDFLLVELAQRHFGAAITRHSQAEYCEKNRK